VFLVSACTIIHVHTLASCLFVKPRCLSELFGRPGPSPRTSLKSADSDFENTSDSDSDSACYFVCLFVCLRIYTVKKSTFHKKNPKFQIFLFLNPVIPFINHMHRYLL
jgi:hypothetical protein